MLDKKLNVGDHIVNSSGALFLIKKVNKTTYSIVTTSNVGYYERTIPFNGKVKEASWSSAIIEYFPCDNAVEQIIANLRNENNRLKIELLEQKGDIEKARTLKDNLEWLSCNSLTELENIIKMSNDYSEDE